MDMVENVRVHTQVDEMQALKNENAMLKEKVAEHVAEVENLKAELDSLKDQHARLRMHHDSLELRVNGAMVKSVEAGQDWLRKYNEIYSLFEAEKEKVNALLIERNEVVEAIEAAEKELEGLNHECDCLRTVVDEHRSLLCDVDK